MKNRNLIIRSLSKEFKQLEKGEKFDLSFTIPKQQIKIPAHIYWESDDHAEISGDEQSSFWENLYFDLVEKAKKKYAAIYNERIKNLLDKCYESAKMFGEDGDDFWKEVYNYETNRKKIRSLKRDSLAKKKRDAIIASVKKKLSKKEQEALGLK